MECIVLDAHGASTFASIEKSEAGWISEAWIDRRPGAIAEFLRETLSGRPLPWKRSAPGIGSPTRSRAPAWCRSPSTHGARIEGSNSP